MSEELPPIVKAVFRQLDADTTLRTLAPGGIHFAQGPQEIALPCVLIMLPEPVETVPEFKRTAYVVGTVRVFACDESASAKEAQAIADRVEVLLRDQPLDAGSQWHWMSTEQTGYLAELIDEEDLSYQRRGANYRVMMCPI
jgi:hypothetical protein